MRTDSYGKIKKKNILKLFFEQRMTMRAIAKKYSNKPSYATIRRWVKAERERVANNKPPLTPKNKQRGRPPVFTQKDVEKMRDFMKANKHKVIYLFFQLSLST